MQTDLPKHDIVLWGVGHTNAHVLRMWKMHPIPNARLTCVSDFSTATYSGMLPGVLAGQYSPERMEIDLVRLCAASGARLIVGKVRGIDHSEKRLVFADRSPIAFDLLSIGIGSTPAIPGTGLLDETVVPIKPMQTFLSRLEQRLLVVRDRSLGPIRVVVVGGGAGGAEISLALTARLRAILGDRVCELTLVTASQQLIGGVTDRTAILVARELKSRGVNVLLNRRVRSVMAEQVVFETGETLPADVVLWATHAVGSTMLGQLGLPIDERGFLLTRATLQSLTHDSIFAVGDSGSLQHGPTPKAGVYAVRQGMVLWDNLQRALQTETLKPFRPQSQFLKLLNLGDGRAVGEWRGLTFVGRWAMHWKDRIDGRFMDKYQDYAIPQMSAKVQSASSHVMRCAGCGGKIGGSILSRVLSRLDIPKHEHVELGLETPDDAAILRLPPGRAINATVDFFASPFDDPYTVGRIAVLHAASDCFATGAKPIAALASATILVGRPRQQEQLLFELLSGALRELRAMGATLVGGHTIEGPQTTIGFTMLAEQSESLRTKAKLRVGDCLVLTKPLGSGVLLAAHMQANCKAAWFELLIQNMLLSNQPAAALCDEFDVSGLTDVTGFGLAGHLLEMLRASGVAAEIQLAQIPLLAGANELLQSGLESTLAPANRDAETDIVVSEADRRSPIYAALFDPQTCGGLLLGISKSQVTEFTTRLAQLSGNSAIVIGQVTNLSGNEPRLRVS